ncbi:MAG: hypothetical protein B5M53_08975 [Candidatus Cloacimonas sp. 4484_209]|nr:MAG: hypothetical protein B5M53_08975 [Candidatus Cloacimonas sp. 4484_209]
MKVPQFIPYIGQEEYTAIEECFNTTWITEGPKADEFNKKLREFINVKYGVFAPNGTLALYLGLKALGIGPGDEVIVPDCTFIASANAVEMVGARPVFVDVNRKNFQIDVNDCYRVLSKKTKAIMPVHLYGMAANMTEVMNFAKRHNLFVIEDAAQALGVKYNGQYCGTFGEVGCFSFFADKTITTGEGGFVVTNNEEIYQKLLYLRNQGRIARGTFIHSEIGYNFRITDIQAAMGLVQLNKFEMIAKKKINIDKLYKYYLKSVEEVTFTTIEPGSDYIPFRVIVFCKNAHKLMEFMSSKGIQPRTFFYPLHKQPCYQYLNQNNDKYFPNAIYGYEHGICLPSFAALTEEQVKYVCDTIKEFYQKY